MDASQGGGKSVESECCDRTRHRGRHADGLADILESVGWLRAIGATKVGITGFCMGGAYAFAAASIPASGR